MVPSYVEIYRKLDRLFNVKVPPVQTVKLDKTGKNSSTGKIISPAGIKSSLNAKTKIQQDKVWKKFMAVSSTQLANLWLTWHNSVKLSGYSFFGIGILHTIQSDTGAIKKFNIPLKTNVMEWNKFLFAVERVTMRLFFEMAAIFVMIWFWEIILDTPSNNVPLPLKLVNLRADKIADPVYLYKKIEKKMSYPKKTIASEVGKEDAPMYKMARAWSVMLVDMYNQWKKTTIVMNALAQPQLKTIPPIIVPWGGPANNGILV